MTTFLCSLALIAFFGIVQYLRLQNTQQSEALKVGFVYVGDASTPYTNNFIRAQKEIETLFGEAVEVYAKENVAEGTEEPAICELIREGCDIIFTTSYGYGVTTKRLAVAYPDVQFCQATCSDANVEPITSNYHNFMGHIYQGRYVAGVVAGMKLEQMIEEGIITSSQAKLGYVAAFPYAEVISGYTAFLLGVKSVVPEATMMVKYTNTWTSYSLEKEIATELINDGAVIISQHSDTTGPAVACEGANMEYPVYHIGYNQSMIDVAPTTSLISCRINWEPYIVSAVEAMIDHKRIEDYVYGLVNGNDSGAGFSEDWVQMLELNENIAAPETKKAIKECIAQFNREEINVFKGDYIGVDPFNPEDTYNLNDEYKENEMLSAPSFHYILQDVITIKE